MKIIIPGASGFLGKNLLQHLPKTWEVIALYNRSASFPSFIKESHLKGVTPFCCDLTQEPDLQKLKKHIGSKFETCVYLAANGDVPLSLRDPAHDLKSNALALINFLHCFKIQRFIFFSSGSVYNGLKGLVSPRVKTNPALPYAISKLTSEQYIQYFKTQGQIGEYVILRFFGAYGPLDSERKVYTKLVKALYLEGKNEFVVRGDGQNLIDAMHIYDTINGILKVIQKKESKNLIVDFCAGQPLTINELVKKAARIFQKYPIKIIHEGTISEYISFRASPKAMKRHFDFEPKIPLDEGLKRFAAFLEKSLSGYKNG